jgi:hypothetical protein
VIAVIAVALTPAMSHVGLIEWLNHAAFWATYVFNHLGLFQVNIGKLSGSRRSDIAAT